MYMYVHVHMYVQETEHVHVCTRSYVCTCMYLSCTMYLYLCFKTPSKLKKIVNILLITKLTILSYMYMYTHKSFITCTCTVVCNSGKIRTCTSMLYI